jgi:ornithine carbamoyltransferase
MTTPRHFLDLDAVPSVELRAILDEAHRRKAARAGWTKGRRDADTPLDGHVLALIFEKNSTRTRVSFDVGMRQLGGDVLILDAGTSQLGRGESVADTARVLSRMVDGIMLRANSHDSLLELAQHATVPVINGLTDRSHPCQILADLLTLEEGGLDLKGARIAWAGDGNNVCVSFMHAASVFGYSMAIATPPGFAPPKAAVESARARGARIDLTDDLAAAVSGADSVVTDTWVSMGDTNVRERMQALGPYQVNAAAMAKASSGAIFLHCLPAHRNDEVTDEVMDGPQSRVFEEAENRVHAQKAVLLWCAGKL